ncbi:hypothetical protein EDF71_109161 [Comamonas sp. JUb58]|nr:hypothetical protein EDF71_109161 [Comamonas sp. JUb58]
MFKIYIFIFTLIYSNVSLADHNRLVVDDVLVKTHAECLMNEFSDNWDTAENWMTCGLNADGLDTMFFRKSDKFIENVVHGHRKKKKCIN